MASKKISQLPSGSANIPLSGQTAVVYSGVTHQQTLSSLRQILVNSGSHYFTGSQFINGNLVVTGSIIAQEYIVSSSVSHITTQTVSGSSNFGDTLDDKHNFTGSVKITGSLNLKGDSDYTGSVKITGSLNVKGNSSLTGSVLIGTGSFETDNPEILHVENSGSFNVIHLQGNNQYYAQLNLKNTSAGNNASGDIVVTANNGNESIHYVDMGINSSTYTGGFVGYANDAYLINAGKDLYIGTIGGVNHPSSLKLFALNLWEDPQITISGSRQISFNTGSVSNDYVYEFSGSVKLDNDLKVDGAIGTDYIFGNTQQWNYLALNGSVSGVSDVELGSNNNISLWAEGGYINVTGSLNVDGIVNSNGYNIDANGGNIEGVNFNVNGILNIGAISERVTPYDDTNTFNHSYTESAILYVTNISDDFTINITDISEDNNHALGFTAIVEQGSTPYSVDLFKIYNTPQSIMWVGGLPPVTVANSVNVFSFSMLRIGGDWKVFGQLTTF